MPRKRLLITRPNHDVTTSYLSAWSKKIIEAARNRNIDVIDLHDRRANSEEVEQFIMKKEPELIIFNGHGSEKEIIWSR